MHTPEGDNIGKQVPGHALVMQNDKPFRGLASFGNSFLSKFEGVEVAASILRNITLIDTPVSSNTLAAYKLGDSYKVNT